MPPLTAPPRLGAGMMLEVCKCCHRCLQYTACCQRPYMLLYPALHACLTQADTSQQPASITSATCCSTDACWCPRSCRFLPTGIDQAFEQICNLKPALLPRQVGTSSWHSCMACRADAAHAMLSHADLRQAVTRRLPADFLKLNFPAAFSASLLAWGLLEFADVSRPDLTAA